MNKLKSIALLIVNCFLCGIATAQETADNGLMRGNGKIFVVMAVVVTILVGLFIYLTAIDRKISKLEQHK